MVFAYQHPSFFVGLPPILPLLGFGLYLVAKRPRWVEEDSSLACGFSFLCCRHPSLKAGWHFGLLRALSHLSSQPLLLRPVLEWDRAAEPGVRWKASCSEAKCFVLPRWAGRQAGGRGASPRSSVFARSAPTLPGGAFSSFNSSARMTAPVLTQTMGCNPLVTSIQWVQPVFTNQTKEHRLCCS